MPNWCYNELRVSGPHAQVRAFQRRVRSLEWVNDPESGEQRHIVIPLDFETILPMPEVLRGKQPTDSGDFETEIRKLFEDPGIENDSAWSWRIRSWGTKWRLDTNTEHCYQAPDLLLYRFESAWTPPDAWVEAASRAFPELRLALAFDEPSCEVTGVVAYVAGEEVPCTEDEERWAESIRVTDSEDDEEETST